MEIRFESMLMQLLTELKKLLNIANALCSNNTNSILTDLLQQFSTNRFASLDEQRSRKLLHRRSWVLNYIVSHVDLEPNNLKFVLWVNLIVT